MCIILWSPLSRSLRSLRFGPGECFGFSFSVVCSVLPLRLKDLPLTFPLEMAFCLRRIRWRETIAWQMQRVLSVLFPSRQAQPCQYEDVRREQDERLADLRGADLRGARGSTNQDLDRQAGPLEGATMPKAASCNEEEGRSRRVPSSSL
jgi:hypothetical protein